MFSDVRPLARPGRRSRWLRHSDGSSRELSQVRPAHRNVHGRHS